MKNLDVDKDIQAWPEDELDRLRLQIADLQKAQAKHNTVLQALMQTEARFRATFEGSLDAFFLFTGMQDTNGQLTDFQFTDLNSRGEKMLGLTRQQIIGKGMCELFSINKELGFFDKYVRVFETGQVLEEEFSLLDKNNKVSWFKHQIIPLADGLAISTRDITSLKNDKEQLQQTMSALQRSESRLRQVIESDLIGVVFWNLDGTISEANNAFLRMVGYTQEDLQAGKLHWRKMTPPEYLAVDAKAIVEMLQNGISNPFEKEYLRKDGSRVPILLGTTFLDGTQDQGAAFVLDMTERKRAEQELAATKDALAIQLGDMTRLHEVSVRLPGSSNLSVILDEVLRTVTELQGAALGLVRLYDADTDELYIVKSLGFSDEYLARNKRIKSGVQACGRASLERRRIIVENVETDPFYWDFLDIARLGGYQAVYSTPLYTGAGETVGTIASFFEKPHRPSEREIKLVELYARQAAELIDNAQLYQEVQESQERLAFLTEVSTILGSSLDHKTSLEIVAHLAVPTLGDLCTIDLWNEDQSFYRTAFAHAEAAKEQLMEDWDKRFPTNNNHTELIWRVLDSDQTLLLPEINETDLQMDTHQQEYLEKMQAVGPFYSFLLVPLSARGRKIGVASFATTDLSKRRYSTKDLTLAQEVCRRAAIAIDNSRLYREAQEAAESQKELGYLKDLFMSVASHELRTPLTAIKGYAQILQRQLGKQREADLDQTGWQQALEKNIRSVDTIVRQSERMNNLVNQLLDFSRLQNRQLEIIKQPNVDLIKLVKQIVEEQRATNISSTIKLQLNHKTIIGNFDEQRIEQVINNLISNAIKYSPSNTFVTVGLDCYELSRGKNEALVWVQDQGAGIAKPEQNHIFERFYRARTQKTVQVEGLGLGLYISYEIISGHGGKMWLESEREGGSTFYFTIPLNT